MRRAATIVITIAVIGGCGTNPSSGGAAPKAWSVTIDPSVDGNRRTAVLKAADAWVTALATTPCPAAIVVTTGTDAAPRKDWEINVVADDPPTETCEAMTRQYPRGGEVMLRATGPHVDDPRYWRVAAHEIGHGLGLAHSDARESIMRPVWVEDEPAIADVDLAAYTARWCASE